MDIIAPGTEISINGSMHVILECEQVFDSFGTMTKATITTTPVTTESQKVKATKVNSRRVPASEAEY